MFSPLIKTQPDWHNPINQNFSTAGDKLLPAADVTFDAGENAYIVAIRNLPPDVASGVPATMPDVFSLLCRMPNAFVAGAAVRIGTTTFTPSGAAFAAGDVVTIQFDRLVNKCFFASGGGQSIVPVEFTITALSWVASTAYEGFAYQASLDVPGLTPVDLLSAHFDLPSEIVGMAAGVGSAGDTNTNEAIFYAVKHPVDDMSGKYVVFKGVA